MLRRIASCWLGFAVAWFASGCDTSRDGVYQGYIEGEFVYIAPPLAGTLLRLSVTRGALVKKGAPLFDLESESETSAAREAEHRLQQAQARLEDLTKGKRPSEIASLEGQLARARAELVRTESELGRQIKLREDNLISPDDLDRAQATRDGAQALVASLGADLETARLGGRADEIAAARADLEALRAALARARWSVDQKSQSSPVNAQVQDTLYRPGEWVAEGSPVVVLLPPENLKVRFFVPQAALPGIHPGQTATVKCDGAAQAVRATVNFISTQAEFTPPVIYSRENRAKLVFMIEATLAAADAGSLRPGQPTDVSLEAAAR